MRKYIAAAVLCAGMLVAGTDTGPVVSAQGAKAKAGHIEIGKGKDGKYRFTVRDADEKFLALSGAYASEKECREGIETLKKVIVGAKVSVKEVKDTKGNKKPSKD
jgi:uncharacterized protein YegP (UPF0339 family)